jgi:membrane-bound lytic murein transglycosylase A
MDADGVAAVPPNARLLGVSAGPDLASIAIAPGDAAGALSSFIESCPVLLQREDASGLTSPDDWRETCAEAENWAAGDARSFFESSFTPVRVGDGAAFATGYFEPEILGSRTRRPGFDVPVYAMPDDLVRAWPKGTSIDRRDGKPPLGRYDREGRFVPYFSRAEIESGALEGRGLELAWAADPVELFFLQIQGSGRIRTPEGEVIRIGYAGQNGHAYTAIGAVLKRRGLLGDQPGQYPASMQGIMQYLRENPEEGRAVMRMNESWVFFRELEGDGPLGSIGVPVRGEHSVAVDPAYVPYGAPVFLNPDRPEARGLWIAQDTGGAIRGPNRFDTFWGAGERAREIAGGMTARGDALVLLPTSAAERLLGQ